MHEQVFPGFAVKQAMREVEIDREDDIVVSSIQADLTTKCVNLIMKGAIVSCLHNKRKYINERDVAYALATTTFPVSPVHPSEVGYLLDTRQLGAMCHTHIELISDICERLGIKKVPEIKISADTLLIVQDAVERLIRGFFAVFKKDGEGRAYGYRLFDNSLSCIVGDPGMPDSTFVSFERSDKK